MDGRKKLSRNINSGTRRTLGVLLVGVLLLSVRAFGQAMGKATLDGASPDAAVVLPVPATAPATASEPVATQAVVHAPIPPVVAPKAVVEMAKPPTEIVKKDAEV